MNINLTDDELVQYVIQAKKRGKDFRDNYLDKVNSCIEHYNCTHPDSWGTKEAWQSKIFIPQAYKNVEVGSSMLVKMLLGQKDFFEVFGFDDDEEDIRDALTEFTVHVLQKGNFYNVASLAIKEACITSTCFFKTVDVSKGKGDFTLNFIPRPFHNVYIDPSVSTYWINARFKIDEYEKDVSEIIDSDLYTYGKKYFDEIIQSSKTSESKAEREVSDGQTQVGEDQTYQPHTLLEFHGKVKDPETKKDVNMLLAVIDERWLVRKEVVDEDEDSYDVIRVNPVPTEFYGTGLIEKDLDVQKLMNGVINLWFDNWKLSVMKMFMADPDGNIKWETVKIKPGQVIKAGKNALTPIEMGMPVSGMDILGVLDQISQEVTGVSKVAQGQSSPSADETLGEIQLKLSRSDARFVQIAKFIEAEFLGKMIKKIISYIIKKCPQSYVDKIMGTRKVTKNILGFKKEFKVKRLDLEYIRKQKDLDLDFQPIGISRFSNKADEQAKYEKLLAATLQSEQLGMMVDIKKLFKKTLQVTGFDNIDFLYTEDEMTEMMNNLQAPQGTPQGAGLGVPPSNPVPPQGIPPQMQGGM